ncbi:MAG TPA: hypothetical protein PKH09_02910, partial [Parvularculaceae bacterium]|nr:hypothetical protein [Parvularculaceae bacterium]
PAAGLERNKEIRYEAGVHDAGVIRLGNNQTLVLADGAVVRGSVSVEGTNVAIRGTGILCGNAHTRFCVDGGHMLSVQRSKSVLIEGITLRGSANWTLVVSGSDGLDELTTTGVSYVAELRDGVVREFEVSPEDAGLPRAAPECLKGGTPDENADALRRLLAGERGPYRDIAILNAAAALVIADATQTLRDGTEMAAQSIDEGRARNALALLIAISNETST